MGVIHGLYAASPSPGGHGIDLDTAELFLRAQASWLRQGLARADDPAAVAIVLRRHDDAHQSWLGLIALADRNHPDVGALIQTLYGFHGRVAGTLHRGGDAWLCERVTRDVRAFLARRLDELTHAVVDALESVGVPEPTATAPVSGSAIR
jgi:hypothetical protein